VCADAVVTQQYTLPSRDSSYDLDPIAHTDDDLRLGCQVLSGVGCDAIGAGWHTVRMCGVRLDRRRPSAAP
jgi:hypothetical protein